MLYNNHIFAIAGLVAETLEQRPWEELVRDLILVPLGMNGTRLVGEVVTSPPANFARSYVYLNDSFIPVELRVLQ